MIIAGADLAEPNAPRCRRYQGHLGLTAVGPLLGRGGPSPGACRPVGCQFQGTLDGGSKVIGRIAAEPAVEEETRTVGSCSGLEAVWSSTTD